MPIQMLLSQAGPLPIKTTFQSVGDETVYLEVNGSVWTQEPNSMTGIAIEIDGEVVAVAMIFSNTPSTHRAVVPAYVPVQLGEGEHTLTLYIDNPQTISDSNDLYTAVIHY